MISYKNCRFTEVVKRSALVMRWATFAGSNPVAGTIYGVVAQLGEHLSGRQEVASSMLVNSTIISGYRTA